MGNSKEAGCNISRAERVKVIERLDENGAYYGHLKRCHVYQLFIDSRGSNEKAGDDFIVKRAQSISTPVKPTMGNPHHVTTANITELIMREVYAQMEERSEEYTKKYRVVSNLRKLGQCLDLLVVSFGYGLLGLVPVATGISTSEPCLGIS